MCKVLCIITFQNAIAQGYQNTSNRENKIARKSKENTCFSIEWQKCR